MGEGKTTCAAQRSLEEIRNKNIYNQPTAYLSFILCHLINVLVYAMCKFYKKIINQMQTALGSIVKSVRIHFCTFAQMNIHVCVHTNVWACKYVYMYIYVCIHTQIPDPSTDRWRVSIHCRGQIYIHNSFKAKGFFCVYVM